MSLSRKKTARQATGRRQKVVVIVGPTASGKSDLAVALAERYRGEIISADSRQIYRGLDIGTGKITKKEMRGVPHYLLDIASPQRAFTALRYVKKARRIIADIAVQGKLPIIAGGTGFWIQALVDGILLPEVPPDTALRKILAKKPVDELFALLEKLDPKRARTIDRKNPRRLIRAIEIARLLGAVPPLRKEKPRYEPFFIGIKLPREKLKQRIEKRTDAMLRRGLLAEVRRLVKSGTSPKRIHELGFEYALPADYLAGKISKKELRDTLNAETFRYAKRQITWFHRDQRIRWVRTQKEAFRETRVFLAHLRDV